MPEIGGTAFTLKDWVRETTQTVGTGSYQLDGPVTIDDVTYLSFINEVGNGNQTAYVVIRGSQRERGIGTVSAGSPPTLSRDVILGGSSGTSPVNWTGGDPKDIFIDAPSELLNQIESTVFASTKVTAFTVNGSFVKDAKCIEVEVHCIGGGGGGGGAPISGASAAAEGAGGGGGAYSYRVLATASLASSVTVTIGQGGNGGGGAVNGSAGTSTSFGSHCVADGGAGGTQGTATTGNNFIASAIGGEAADGTGTILIPGGFSGCGRVIQSAGGAVWVGANYGGAGAGPWGGQVIGGTTTSTGANGRLYGGGGAGAHTQNSAAATGGDGADGICVVIERLTP